MSKKDPVILKYPWDPASSYHVEITESKLKCLEPGKWLDDDLIILAVFLLQSEMNTSRIAFVRSHFWHCNFDDLAIKDLVINGSPWDKKMFISPINYNNVHWAVLAVHEPRKFCEKLWNSKAGEKVGRGHILYFDSLHLTLPDKMLKRFANILLKMYAGVVLEFGKGKQSGTVQIPSGVLENVVFDPIRVC